MRIPKAQHLANQSFKYNLVEFGWLFPIGEDYNEYVLRVHLDGPIEIFDNLIAADDVIIKENEKRYNKIEELYDTTLSHYSVMTNDEIVDLVEDSLSFLG